MFSLALKGAFSSLIAALTSRPPFTSPARVMVLFAVSVSCRNIWSGPEDRHCKVHNGLTLITHPPARRAIACTLALWRCVLAHLTSFEELRCHGRRGPAERLARHCAGLRTACAPRLLGPCLNPSVARSPRPNPSDVAVALHDEGSQLRLRISACAR